MAQEVKKLTDAKIKALLNEGKPGLTNDGGGLYLRIGRGGTASWVHKHERGGKVRELGLGSYPAVPLAAVRGKAAELRQQIAAGDAPLSKREQVKNGAKGGLSLEEVAKQYIRVHETSWKNPVHRQQWHTPCATMYSRSSAAAPSSRSMWRTYSGCLIRFGTQSPNRHPESGGGWSPS